MATRNISGVPNPNQPQLPGFETPRAPTGAGSGGTGPIIETDFKTLHERLGSVIASVTSLDTAVKNLTRSLQTSSGAGVVSGGPRTTGGNLTTGSFGTPVQFGGANRSASFGGGGGAGSPNTNTVAPVSGGMGRSIALAAAGEIGAGWAGSINSGMSKITTGGMPTDVLARQTAGVFGGNSVANVSGMTGFTNMSSTDLNTAMATLMANPMLFPALKKGSQQQRGLQGFMNTLQKLNPTMGAAGAASTANQLVSGPTLQALQRFGARNGQAGQGLINPANMSVNSTSRVFSELLQAVTGGKQLNASGMRSLAGNTRDWTTINQNNNVPGLGLGLSPQMLVELRQFAAAGGNLNKAEAAIAGSPAVSGLKKTTAQTAATQAVYQNTVTEQNLVNTGLAKMYSELARLTGESGPLPALLTGFASVGSGILSVGAHLAEFAALLKILKGGSTATGAGEGAAGGVLARLGLGAGTAESGAAAVEVAGRGSVAAAVLASAAQTDAMAHGHVLDPLHVGSAENAIGSWAKSVPGAVSQLGKDIWHLGDPTGATSTAGMAPAMQKRMGAMMAANPNLKISSGHRTSQQQANLYALKGGQGVAKPGQSAHQAGIAADVGPSSQFGWLAKNAQKFGLGLPAPRSEPWHVQMGDPVTASGVMGSQVVGVASGQLGTPYGWGAESPGHAFDCSGLVQYVFGKLGISLPRTSQQQATVGSPVKGLSSAQPGDLILYNEPGEGPNSHVAIYIGGGKQIAAPYTGTVVQVQGVDTAHISTIRRVVGGGAGSSIVQAAQTVVGSPSNDSQNHSSGGTVVGLSNNFLSMVQGSWLSGGGPAGAGTGNTGGGGGGSTASSGSGTSTTATANVTSAGGGVGNVGSINSPTAFSKAVLAGLGISANNNDITDINAWQQAEGQWGAKGAYNATVMHDPLNTKLPEPGSSSLGGLTNSYPTWQEGVQATVSTIRQGNMAAILSSLKSGANLASFSKALESTGWASSAYGGRSFPAPSGVYAMGDPVSSMSPYSNAMGGMPSVSASGMSGSGRSISVTMPIQVVGVSQQDAQMLAQMVITQVRSLEAQDALGSR